MDKKLSDNEIVKALECCANFSTQKDCDLCPIGVIKCFEQENLMPQFALDLINRLKEGRKTFFRIAKQRNEEKRELQKKIDELKEKTTDLHLDKQELMNEISEHKNAHERLNEAYVNLNNLYQQAVKETAKEIFEKLLGYMGSQQQFCIVDEEHKTLIDCDKLFDFVGNLAKEKGVEVE